MRSVFQPIRIMWALIAALVGYEAWALKARRRKGAEDDTITRVILREVPWYITMPILAWLLVHFGLRYFDEPDEEHLL